MVSVMGLLRRRLAERVAVAHVNRRAAAQVGQREGGLPVAAVGRPEQREQRLVLIDGQRSGRCTGPTPSVRTGSS